MTERRALPDANLPPWSGGRTQVMGAAIAGAAGLLLTFIGMAVSPQRALLAYLVAYVYWLGLAIGAVTLVMANHAAGARWNVTVRRFSETFGAVIPLFIVLFLPLLFGAKHVWFWVAPHEPVSKEMHELLHHKRPYLNLGFFIQDETADPALTVRARWWSPPGLLLFAITFTFAAFDWLMSLQPTWYSTIFGLYIYIGAFVASVALLCLVITGVRSSGSALGAVISVDQQHNAGKLLLAFTAFWAYMAFSQYMLIWAGNLPEELQWIVVRSHGVWRPVGILILVGHFVVPFFLLLSRDLKRSAPALGGVAAWMLVIHYIDLYWVVMPAAEEARLGLHWTHVTAFAGVGGVSIAAALFLFRAARPVPVGDPFLSDSLRYVQP
ncbi:MAG: hypothetical protein E6J82_15660 [Deltaproteobacteria bacterium]|nr:MAG: hypothetical protein E6J82_15660 [Deltaproteobacteria bacterium]